MRILLWHGYLLGGTGSNVYTRALAREWSRAGHEVVVFTQEPHPESYDLGGAQVVRPDIGGLLPVFVLDRYEGVEARLLQDFTREERERYVELNAAALQARLPADVVFANHVLLGGPVGAASGARYAVKAHGSELEYSMRGRPELAVIVGFGDYRADLEAMAPARTLFSGPLEHRHLVHLLPLADVSVVPSIFPEAFGMVAAEAAATGTPPLVARHSGLAEIAAGLEDVYPPEHRTLAGFATGDAVDLRAKLETL